MPIRTSNGVSLVALASFVFTLGAAVGPERQAFAQQTTTPPKTAPQGETTEEAAEDSAKKEDPAKKKAAEAGHADGELDTSVESHKAVYISGDLGFTRSDLGGLSNSLGFDRTVANGLLYGFGAGLRLKDLRLGARWRVYDTTEFQLWTFALSAGYGLPLRPVSPVFSAHVGYVFDQHVEEALIKGSLPAGTVIPPDVDLKGLLVGIDVNASYWVTRFLRLGLFIGADALVLNRAKVSIPTSIFGVPPELAANPLYKDSGSSVGLNVNAGLRGAFDIAFK